MAGFKLFLFGLDRAGKTAIVKGIKEEKDLSTTPTLSFGLGKWIIKDIEFQVWDAPGQVRFRGVWSRGFNKAKLLFFVLDTADSERFVEAKNEFDKVINDIETQRIPLLFCFHKMDIPEAKANLNKAREVFKLPRISQQGERPLYQFQTSIKDLDTLEPVKDALVKIVEDSRW